MLDRDRNYSIERLLLLFVRNAILATFRRIPPITAVNLSRSGSGE